jgi:hypothetical protein
MRKSNSFWRSGPNLFWIALSLAALAVHVTLRNWYPSFTPPASSDKPLWMRTALYSELALHIAVLGAVITAIRNRIPWWKRPAYSDEGTLTIDSTEILPQPETQWAEISWIALEFSIYLAIWARVYRIF